MFANTLTLTVNAVAKVMNRINQDSYGSEYEFASDTETVNMKIRHSKDSSKDGTIRRHNVFIEYTQHPTPTTAKKYWSSTYTLRELIGSGPAYLDFVSQGTLTLVATLDTGLTVGEN